MGQELARTHAGRGKALVSNGPMGGLACWSNKNGAITRCNLVFDTLVCLNRVPGIPSYRFSDFLYLVSACGPRWASEFGVSSNTEDVAG